MHFDEAAALAEMKERLKPGRYRHCLRVSEEAVRLSALNGADPEKCRIAGLFHDCAKGMTEEEVAALDPALAEMGKPENGGSHACIHGPAGAVIAGRRYGIMDEEILEAIRCHVTGMPGMGKVAEAVFLADYTEPGREGRTFYELRAMVTGPDKGEEDFYRAIVAGCDCTIEHVLATGRFLAMDTVKTRNYYLMLIKGGSYDDKGNG